MNLSFKVITDSRKFRHIEADCYERDMSYYVRKQRISIILIVYCHPVTDSLLESRKS
jgi:hypothetical protein